jgi:biotin carboxyl carrier protein
MNPDTFTLRVNDQLQFELTESAALSMDAAKTGDNTYHVIQNHKSYQVSVLSYDAPNCTIMVNGVRYAVRIDDALEQLIQKMGLGIQNSHKINAIKAPMPGLVLQVVAKEGQEVAKGDPLIILEAMKMENILKSPGDGIVKSVHVQAGQAVDKGQFLIDLD